MEFNDFGDDGLLIESLTLILTDTGFLEYVRKGTIAFVDKELDDTDESQGTLNYLLKQQKEYKYLQELAYEIDPDSIDGDSTYQDFVSNEKNLLEMIAFLREDKDVIDFMMGDASVDGDNYTEVVIELANFIKSTLSTDQDQKQHVQHSLSVSQRRFITQITHQTLVIDRYTVIH